MLEVAEGVKYLHSEGIVHGDLHGVRVPICAPKSVYHIIHQRNVLLNSEFHCQITDFGSTRHFEATVTRSTTAFAMNFVAPELFGMCTTCGLFDCDGCQGDQAAQKRRKTMETDVYSFGCLYYATFFDSIPFHGKTEIQIVRLVTNGKRPDRLESPSMEDDIWHLIQRCWESIPSKRSTIKDITTALASRA
ncbi:kinase-like domain-containing protein [Amanita rubescens]|nr:kinase-like domain-containing protein [Amanita rubescens]